GDKRGTPALRRCLQSEPSQIVKRSCRVALAKLDPAATTAQPASAPAAAPAGAPMTAPAQDAGFASSTASPGGAQDAAPPGAGQQQFDLRINVTAEDAADRPNHIYIDFVSAFDKNTLALGFERVLGAHWSAAIEPQLSADSASAGTVKASAVGVAVAVRPHFYFLQHAPSA